MPRVTRDVQAVADLDGIYDYIAVENHSPLAADRFLDALSDKLQLYATQPRLGELRPDLGKRSKNKKQDLTPQKQRLLANITLARLGIDGKIVSGLICVYLHVLTPAMSRLKREHVLELLRERGVLRPRDLQATGISGAYLNKLHAEGLLDRPGRGLYTLVDAPASEHRTFAEACKRVPHGVICLLSALRFHELTTQAPFEVWMAISDRTRRPRVDYPPLRVVYFSGKALSFAIQEHDIEGVTVRVYSPAKTVADCFKYRNKIGLDVAIEALRDSWKQRKATMDELWEAAKVCRMSNIMRPYMESLV